MVDISKTVNKRTFKLIYNSGTDVVDIQYSIRVRSNVDGSTRVYTTINSMIRGVYETEEISFDDGIYYMEVFISDAVFQTIALIVDTTGRRSGTTTDSSYFGCGL